MKILHTSDWHLGHSLYGRKRYDEFESFLDWLLDCINTEKIDVVLISGDIFDNGTPSNRALEQYYRFLWEASDSCCRHVVVTAGNHDSPSLLSAPASLLRSLNIHVTGSLPENPEDEVLILDEPDGTPGIIVCAVPYLRDRDIRKSVAGESTDEKTRKLLLGMREHYTEVCSIAESKRSEHTKNTPIIAMGHLFAAGGKTIDGDGVRELYVGNLARAGSETFPECIDYLALGHLHVPQKVCKNDAWRYCGSPLPMSFGEAEQHKMVVTVDFSEDRKKTVKEICVPNFQKLKSLEGSLETVETRLWELKTKNIPVWVEVILNDTATESSVQERLREQTENSLVEILKVQNTKLSEQVLHRTETCESLDDLTELEVFRRCLSVNSVPNEECDELTAAFCEIINSIHEQDLHAE